jgi:predicted RND superfamily exporter protein
VNANTAIGFFTLIFTKINVLVEFGIVGTLSVIFTFFVSILLVPILCSFLPAPNPKQVKHIDGRFLSGMIRIFDGAVQRRRWIIYVASIVITGASVWGCWRLNTVAHMVDDLPSKSRVHKDLQYLEEHYGGVMPFEIVINTHKKDGINDVKVLKKVDELQQRLRDFPEISRSISILDAIKFGRQAWLNGDSAAYQLPTANELLEISALKPDDQAKDALGKVAITDSLNSKIRIKANVADVGSVRMNEITDSLQIILDELFITARKSGKLKEGETYKLYGKEGFKVRYDGKEYEAGESFTANAATEFEVMQGEGAIDYNDHYVVTGTTKIFLRSNDFLVNNLAGSLIWALVLNAVLMAILFRNIKMVIISFLPNIVPLVVTAGIMGFIGLDLKPSTALIFSISFGITVDNTIHFLARYRYARRTGDNIRGAITNSFKDTGLSMIYTSIILFFGFVIFTGSSFGSTVALGLLTSITLVIALFANLLILPALIITFYREDEQLGKALVDEEEEEEAIETMAELVDVPDEPDSSDTNEKIS